MRVIAGEFGGRRLDAPRGLKTRPTSDRVREALFMSLEPLEGLRVVDLFAGSGALGIEALSRGAAWVDFVEAARPALDVLARNLDALGVRDRCRVWPLRLPGALIKIGDALAGADLVLADPPYGGDDARAVLETLGECGRLRTGARVALERHQKDDVPSRTGDLALVRERRYGETTVNLYQVGAAELPEADRT